MNKVDYRGVIAQAMLQQRAGGVYPEAMGIIGSIVAFDWNADRKVAEIKAVLDVVQDARRLMGNDPPTLTEWVEQWKAQNEARRMLADPSAPRTLTD